MPHLHGKKYAKINVLRYTTVEEFLFSVRNIYQ